MLSMWLLLCHIGSTSQRAGSTESIRNLHLLYSFGRESCVCSMTRLLRFSCPEKLAGVVCGRRGGAVTQHPQCQNGAQWCPALSPLPSFLFSLLGSPTCQFRRKTKEVILLLVVSECFIQERSAASFAFDYIIGPSATN